MSKLIEQLVEEKYLTTPRIIHAFQRIKRVDFIPRDRQGEAGVNYPLPIGFGQTISQPLTVALMFELLAPREGDKVLDIGSGSGWTTSLFAEIVGEKGEVYGIELIPELKEFGEANAEKYDFVSSGRAKFFCRDGAKGLPEAAPFDCIHVAAAAARIPPALLEQLKVGGRLVIPIGIGSQDIILVTKKGEGDYQRQTFPGFTFVPLVEKRS